MVGKTLGPYEIKELLGAGGMGEVYRAEDTRLGRKVAIKVLPAEFADDRERLARFEQEARAAAALNHPHIAAVFDFVASFPDPLMRIPTGGGPAEPLFELDSDAGEAGHGPASYLPDGDRVLYSYWDDRWRIAVRSLSTGERTLLTEG